MTASAQSPGTCSARSAGVEPDAGLLFLARRGVAEAQFQLGRMYLAGEGDVRYDTSEAARWFLAAAEQDHVDAQVRLAEAYCRGEGVCQDPEEAAHWFRAAAAGGDEDSVLRLGMMYGNAEATMHRDPEAKYRLEAAAIAGHPPARYLLQRLCAEDETGGPNDDDDAACLDPGFRGTDPPIEDRDPDPAGLQEMVEELLPIAWSGDVAAQCCVGLAYRFGLGVGRDPEEAVRWFRLAADRGDGDACNHLGQMYCRGEGVGGPDHEAALWWFGAAAGRGDRRGLFNLAGMYHNGSGGLLPDRAKAMEFVRQAAGLGHPEAWNSLGVACYEGDGVERNEEKAISCLRAAAARGSWNGAYNLGALCADGRVALEQHPDRIAWLLVAEEGGYEPAEAALAALEAWEGELEQSREQAARWIPRSCGGSPPPLRNDLGLRFVGGRGDFEDPVEAIQWCHDRVMRGGMALECEV